MFFYDPDDMRLWVPKQYWWLGYTINFARLFALMKENPKRMSAMTILIAAAFGFSHVVLRAFLKFQAESNSMQTLDTDVI